MKVYVEAQSKAALIRRLAAGEEITGLNYSMFGGGGYYKLDNTLEDGTIIAIYSQMSNGNPVAKSWGTWTNGVLKAETFEAVRGEMRETDASIKWNKEADLTEPDRKISSYEQEPTGKVKANCDGCHKGFGYREIKPGLIQFGEEGKSITKVGAGTTGGRFGIPIEEKEWFPAQHSNKINRFQNYTKLYCIDCWPDYHSECGERIAEYYDEKDCSDCKEVIADRVSSKIYEDSISQLKENMGYDKQSIYDDPRKPFALYDTFEGHHGYHAETLMCPICDSVCDHDSQNLYDCSSCEIMWVQDEDGGFDFLEAESIPAGVGVIFK